MKELLLSQIKVRKRKEHLNCIFTNIISILGETGCQFQDSRGVGGMKSLAELQWNVKGSPIILSDTTDVCSSNQGCTSNCEVELDIPASCVDKDDTSNCPIIFFLHGAGGSNNAFKKF